MKNDDLNYPDFFKEEIYDGFVRFLLGKYSNATCIALLADEPLFTKKGVHQNFRKAFNEFLNQNPRIEKIFGLNNFKTFVVKNIVGEMLHFPVSPEDEGLMVREGIRSPELLPPMDSKDIPRVRKDIKLSAAPMKGQILKGDWKEHSLLVPQKLILHYKRGYAMSIKKTTECFYVTTREQVNNIIFDIYENKVAYALFDGERLTFVKNANPIKKKKPVPRQV